MKPCIFSCRRARCRLEAASSPSTLLLLPCNCVQDFFLRGFPYLHQRCCLLTNSATSRQSKFHKTIGAKGGDKLCIPTQHCQQHRAWNAGERDGASHGWTPGGWTCVTAQKPDTEIITISLMRSHEGFNKITALDCRSWIVTNTPPWCTQAAFNYFKFAKAWASTTSLKHTGIIWNAEIWCKTGTKAPCWLATANFKPGFLLYPEAGYKVQSPRKCRN